MRIISGALRGRTLLTPKGDETRPSSSRLRETVFNMLQHVIEDAHFLDLFAGSGAMAIEALSRGAKHATLIDQSPDAIQVIKKNLSALNLENQTTVIRTDFLDALKRLHTKGVQFDIIFADAPYHLEKIGQELIDWLASHPLIKRGGLLLIENSRKEAPLNDQFTLLSSRRSGKTYLHEYKF
jgi:16S rRNA (guanine966-N2)-methyltransferase